MNDHIPKFILKFIKGTTNNKKKAVTNATKRSSIAEHRINKSIVQITMTCWYLRLLTIVQVPLIWLDGKQSQ